MANTKPVLPEDKPEDYEVYIQRDLMNTDQTHFFIGINGKNYAIQRGVRVNVPKQVYDLLKFKNMV